MKGTQLVYESFQIVPWVKAWQTAIINCTEQASKVALLIVANPKWNAVRPAHTFNTDVIVNCQP